MKRKRLNIACLVLLIIIVLVVVVGLFMKRGDKEAYDDGIESVDLNTIILTGSGVEVHFSDVILSNHKESRKLIVSEQEGTVQTELTDRLIQKLDFNFLKKTQTVTYTGKGIFVVDLDNLTEKNIVQDDEKKTITIKIGHAYLQDIVIDPEKIIIDEVHEGLFARGDVEMTVADYNNLEQELLVRLKEKFDTASNGQEADDIALKMVKEIYEPLVKAVDHDYEVVVEFID